MKAYQYKQDEFDSKVTGLKVAKIVRTENKKQVINDIITELKAENFNYVSYRFITDYSLLSTFESHGFSLIDVILSFSSSFNAEVEKKINVQQVISSDTDQILKNIPGLYSGTRYYNDPTTTKYADIAYTEWVKNSIEKKVADEVLVYRDGNRILGFITVKKDKNALNIPLLGVFKDAQGKGVGKALINGVFSYAKDHNIQEVTVDTQVSNIPAIRTYTSCGFRPISSSFTVSKKL